MRNEQLQEILNEYDIREPEMPLFGIMKIERIR